MKKFGQMIISIILAFSIMIGSCLSWRTILVSADDTVIYYCRHICNNGGGSYQKYGLSQSTIENTPSVNSIYGDTDHRVRDTDNLAVVRLSVGGTGFIVDDHTIVTAAHCVYSNSHFFDDLAIDVVDANNDIVKQVYPKVIHIPYNYRLKVLGNNVSGFYDYAMIEVEEDLSEYGCLSMGVVLDNFVSKAYSTEVKVSGFPGSINGQGGVRYVGTGRISSMGDDALYYTVDTSGGNSGGPVYREFTSSYGTKYKIVVGIHFGATGADNTGSPNKGVRITSDILQFYFNNSNRIYD